MAHNQRTLLQLLRNHGAEIRGHCPSRMHAKWWLADSTLVVGSCNFTKASQANCERGVRLAVDERTRDDLEQEFEALFSAGQRFLEGVGVASPPSPELLRGDG